MKNTTPVLLLLFLSPMLGELLSGNAPPLRFFHPIMLSVFVLLYGCGEPENRHECGRSACSHFVVGLEARRPQTRAKDRTSDDLMATQPSSISKSSAVRFRSTLPSAETIASARSRLVF